jgi:endoglucanase
MLLFACEPQTPSGTPYRPYYGCPQGTANCDGQCLNILSDPLNCGGCGRTCTNGASCVNASCVCSEGTQCDAAPAPSVSPMPSPSDTVSTDPSASTPLPSASNAPPVPLPSGDPNPGLDTPYEQALRLALRFYGAQRAGNQANWLVGKLPGGGAGCFLADGQSLGIDLSGGWFDAGDHIKPTLTIAYASLLMLKAYEAFPGAFDDLYGPRDAAPPVGANVSGTPNGIPDVLDEVRIAADYLASIVVGQSLVMQVGNTETDHSRFFSCVAADDLERHQGGEMQGGARVGREVQLGNGGAAGGLAAASLALMARLYSPYDGTAAGRYLQAARSIYQLSSDQAEGASPYRGSKPLQSKLCGAAELMRATSDAAYTAEVNRLLPATGQHYWVATWDTPHEFCLHSAYLATGSDMALGMWQNNLNLTQSTSANVRDLIHKADWGDWGVLRNAAAAAYSAALAGHVRGNGASRELALRQLDWVLGNNPQNRSYLIGLGPNHPVNPHHRNACEQNQAGPNDGLGCRHLLSGALVSGPSANLQYVDRVSDYVLNEVALDYNAGLVGLAAYAVHVERGGR